jgi:site-specific DNA-methyltransferase (adenine-specific)
MTDIMTEVYRVLKPGAHGLVWALPRTSHWTATALEDAGFEIRDCVYHLYSKHDKLQAFMASLSDEQRVVFETLMEDDNMRLHLFGSGFPKSHNISVAIDKLLGEEREVIGTTKNNVPHYRNSSRGEDGKTNDGRNADNWDEYASRDTFTITAPATPLAQQYSGFGSALKPSVECWWLIRKPLSESSIAKNVMTWGTGAINIDATRIGTTENDLHKMDRHKNPTRTGWIANSSMPDNTYTPNSTGRWPSHLLMTHSLLCNDEQCSEYCPVAILDKQSGYSKSTDRERHNNAHTPNAYSSFNNPRVTRGHNDQGGASRYFAQFQPDAPFIYAPKASRRERSLGCEALPVKEGQNVEFGTMKAGGTGKPVNGTGEALPRQNNHPTVKSQQLMRYMLKLVVPPNGVVLDCFAGSGSTLVAAISEDLHYIGIEQEQEYIEIINARIAHAISEKNKEKIA